MAMICVLIVVLTLVALAASGRHKDDDAPDAAPPRAFIASTDFFRAFSVMAFAFTCHTVAFPVYLELERPSVARMMKVTHGGMGIALALYSALAVAGYFEYSQTTGGVEGDVLVNIGQSEAKAVSIVVRVAFVVSIIGWVYGLWRRVSVPAHARTRPPFFSSQVEAYPLRHCGLISFFQDLPLVPRSHPTIAGRAHLWWATSDCVACGPPCGHHAPRDGANALCRHLLARP
jgi:hypothetical protein